MPAGADGEPVTVVVARRVAPGRESDFLAWEGELTRAASRFSGFLGSGLLHPARAGDPWHVVYRFDSRPHLARWEASPARAELLARADRLVETIGTHRVSGLETWFSLPGRTAPAPARWKMFVATAVCIYALQLVAYATVGQLTARLPLGLRLLVVAVAVTAAMTWLVMPRVTRMLAGWLYPRPRGNFRRTEVI
jgi:hypothetical protein